MGLLSITVKDSEGGPGHGVSLRRYPGRVELGGLAWERRLVLNGPYTDIPTMLRALADELEALHRV